MEWTEFREEATKMATKCIKRNRGKGYECVIDEVAECLGHFHCVIQTLSDGKLSIRQSVSHNAKEGYKRIRLLLYDGDKEILPVMSFMLDPKGLYPVIAEYETPEGHPPHRSQVLDKDGLFAAMLNLFNYDRAPLIQKLSEHPDVLKEKPK